MYTPDLYSDEQTKFRNSLAAGSLDPLKTNEHYGRVRASIFNFSTGAGITVASYTSSKARIGLALLPKGARITRIELKFGAMGAAAKMHLGLFGADDSGYISSDNSTTADAEAHLMSAVDVSAAGVATSSVGTASALNPLYELQKQCYLVATAYNADWAASKSVIGIIQYVVD